MNILKRCTTSGRNYFIRLFMAAIITLTLACPAGAELAVQRDILPNGLTLLVAERHNLPLVKVTLGIKAGSLNEPESKAGLANLTANLLTEGTGSRTALQISEEIEFVGGELGAGGDGEDYVTVSLLVLKKDIDLGFELLSDIILNPVFPDDELEKMKVQLKGALRASEEDPGFVASREFSKAVFGSHPYGRLVTGTVDTIDLIERQDLRDFHSAYYVPNNSIISVVGDITVEEVRGLIDKYLRKWSKKEIQSPALPEIMAVQGRKTITVDKELTQANVIMGHIGVNREHPDYYPISVMNYILGGGGFASRLMQNVRVEKGLVYDVRSRFAPQKYSGSFQAGLQTKNESANTAIEEVLKEINRIRTEPVSEAELSDAKAFLTGSFPMRIETTGRIADFLVAVEIYGLGMDYIKEYPSYINRITREDILSAAKIYLDPENIVLVVVADQEKAAINKDLR